MGGELGQRREWAHDEPLEWFVLEHALHRGVRDWVRDLNGLYRACSALYETDFDPKGFEWVNCENTGKAILSFLRRGGAETSLLLAVFNFSDAIHRGHRVGVPRPGVWRERLNSDSEHYGGKGEGNLGAVATEPVAADGHDASLRLTLPPLSALFFEPAPLRRRARTARKKSAPLRRRE